MTFEEWMKDVDIEIERFVGMSNMELADQPYRDWYDDEVTPHQAAVRALREEGLDCD